MAEHKLKVMLVDDEYLVRDLLRNCINWDELGLTIVAEASSASEAFEKVDATLPDIIFSDICMPSMDGMEFSRIVIEKYPSTKIIILTGYDEFEYAKKSLKLGVADFLLKPINDDEIRNVLIRLRDKIIAERNKSQEYRRLQKQLEENLPFIKEKFFNELIQWDVETQDLTERMAFFHIGTKPDAFEIAVIEVSHPETADNIGEEDKLLLTMECMEIVKQFFRDDAFVNVFFDNYRRVVVMKNDDGIDFSECCEMLKTKIINSLGCYVCIGAGGARHEIGKIHLSYREACDALYYRVIAGKNQVINYSDIDFSVDKDLHLQNDKMDTFRFFLRAGVKEKADELIELFFNQKNISKVNAADSIKVIASNIVSVILSVTVEMGIDNSEIITQGDNPYERIFKTEYAADLKEYIISLAAGAMDIINGMRSKKVNSVIKNIKDYLNDNIANSELSLSSVAKVFFINPSYLSRIFKQETGQTFVEYLTKIRMEKAAKLIKENDMKAYQVAESVGITDPHYFGICFKKYTGMSINDFKKIG